MRNALNAEELKGIYARIAKRYDFQHALITASADQRGRTLLVGRTVSPTDKVLDCGLYGDDTTYSTFSARDAP